MALSSLRKLISFVCLVLISTPVHAQLYSGNGWGVNAGIVSALGNRFQRIGLTLQSYYYRNFVQVNAEVRAYHNFRNLGPAMQYNELVTSAGIVLGYGTKQIEYNPFLNIVGNQTHYTHSFGYSYNLYFDRVKTTQQTGIIALQFNKISLISENDIFARPILDRFRTGALLVQYQYDDHYQFGVNFTMWTGHMKNEITDLSDYPFIPYMDTLNGVYTRYSHGLLSAQCKMLLDHGQNVQGNLGVDAEQVRNAMQNRLIHGWIFGKKLFPRSNNYYMPMIDTTGEQYLYRPEQRIRKPKPYWNLFTSPATFY